MRACSPGGSLLNCLYMRRISRRCSTSSDCQRLKRCLACCRCSGGMFSQRCEPFGKRLLPRQRQIGPARFELAQQLLLFGRELVPAHTSAGGFRSTSVAAAQPPASGPEQQTQSRSSSLIRGGWAPPLLLAWALGASVAAFVGSGWLADPRRRPAASNRRHLAPNWRDIPENRRLKARSRPPRAAAGSAVNKNQVQLA